jgi:DNA-binding transcriptional ArsR family regulator
MAIRWKAKTTSAPDREDVLAGAFKGLGHPARLHLFRTMLERGPLPAGELALTVPLAPSTVSQHLAQLKRCGLVRDSAQGLLRVYEVDRKAWDQFRRSLLPFLTSISTKYESSFAAKPFTRDSPGNKRA